VASRARVGQVADVIVIGCVWAAMAVVIPSVVGVECALPTRRAVHDPPTPPTPCGSVRDIGRGTHCGVVLRLCLLDRRSGSMCLLWAGILVWLFALIFQLVGIPLGEVCDVVKDETVLSAVVDQFGSLCLSCGHTRSFGAGCSPSLRVSVVRGARPPIRRTS